MTTEEEILESLALCENLPDYEDFDKVVKEMQVLSDELVPEASEVKAPDVQNTDVEVDEPISPIAASSANVKYDEVTRPIPTIKGVPVEEEKIDELVDQVVDELAKEDTKETIVEPEESDEPIKTIEPVNPIEDEPEEDEETPLDKKKEIIKGVISLFICVLIAFGISYGITHYVAHHTQVEGSSMEPNLHDGDEIIVEKVSYYINEPERYDVIVFPFSDGVYYIKRIIALPGETIQIIDGKIYIDGVQLWENYGNETIEDPGLAKEEITLAKDEYFVLGDNRNSSVDSRKGEVGVVKRKKIVGKAWLRFYPFDRFGVLQHQS